VLQVAIVDDSADVRFLWRALLEVSGEFEVCADAGDGQSAIEIARSLQPDVMLLDLSMPGMGGLEALPLILAESPDTRVVVLSGFGKRGFGERAAALGACGFLEKHLPASSLAPRLLDVLAGRPTPPDATPLPLRGDIEGRTG
jgi:DNA-binding NarL/FixJ family response regulator